MEILNKSDLSDVIAHEYHGFLTISSHDVVEYVYSGGTVFIPKKITVTEIRQVGNDVVINNNQIIAIKYFKNGKLEKVIETDGIEVIQQDKPFLRTYTFEVQVLKNGVLIDQWEGKMQSHWDDLWSRLR